MFHNPEVTFIELPGDPSIMYFTLLLVMRKYQWNELSILVKKNEVIHCAAVDMGHVGVEIGRK